MLFLVAFLLVNVLTTSLGHQSCEQKDVKTLFRWKQIDFEYPTPEARQEAIDSGKFKQSSVIPLGVERWRDRVFVSTPAWKKGTPATLSALSIVAPSDGPLLKPYPNWEWHNKANCTGFTSVFRMNVDNCGTLWVLDSGQVEGFETPRQICPPTLFSIDLETDTVTGRYPVPDELVLQDSLITNIVVDSRDSQCQDLHVYIVDVRRFGLIVFRATDQVFWRWSHYTFYPEPLFSNYTLHGVNFQWTDGIFGMALGKYDNGDRPLYYHAMSSDLEFVVNTSIIRNQSRLNDSVDEFRLLGEKRGANGQLTSSVIDNEGMMYFSAILRDSIGCWDTKTPYTVENLRIVAHDSVDMVFPNDLRLDHEVRQKGWLITNKLPMYQFDLLKSNEYNFRVMYFDLSTAASESESDKTICPVKETN